jgi:hypothetical protein
MAQTFDLSNLQINNAIDIDFARDWLRVILKDKPSNGVYPMNSMQDEELEAFLSLTSITEDSITYYVPWLAASMILETNPLWLQSVSFGSFSQSYRNLDEIIEAITSSYKKNLLSLYPETIQATLTEGDDRTLELEVGL